MRNEKRLDGGGCRRPERVHTGSRAARHAQTDNKNVSLIRFVFFSLRTNLGSFKQCNVVNMQEK